MYSRPEAGAGEGSGSMLDLESELSLQAGSDLSFASGEPDEDSGEELIGADEDSAMDVLGSDIDACWFEGQFGRREQPRAHERFG